MQRLLVPDHGDYEEANVIFVANDQDDLCVSLWPHTGVVVHKQHTAALCFQVGFILVVLTWQVHLGPILRSASAECPDGGRDVRLACENRQVGEQVC